MNNTPPRAAYESRISTLETRLDHFRKIGRIYIAAKFAAVILGLLGFSRYWAVRRGPAIILLIVFAAAFAAAAGLHERILRRAAAAGLLLRINREELRAADGEFPQSGNEGSAYLDPGHPCAPDLDLFGERSLYHFLSRASTGPGQRALAMALLSQPDGPAIVEAQEAVRELSGKLDFRQGIEASASKTREGTFQAEDLDGLSAGDRFLFGKPLLPVLLSGLPLATLASLTAAATGWPIAPFAGLVLIQAVINKTTARRIEALCGRAARHHRILAACADIIGAVEAEEFTAERLLRLRARFAGADGPASRAIRRLAALLGWMNARSSGVWHALLNVTILWDLQGAYRLERWNSRSARLIPGWLEALGQMEALAALANCAFNHPSWVFPRIHEDGFALKAAALGHPLIPEAERVVNDYALAGSGSIDVLTGPNMAGKSTFLRTVGVNAVLAFAGGPVCAAALDISPFRLITSMKSSDSLDKRMSLFYAELIRLKLILDEIRDGRPAFFLIDEMLRGTNALDRHKGSLAMLKQLLRAGATGIVATHDLDLTALERENPRVVNHHFDSTVEGDNLAFDFKIKPGVCSSFNALVLMKRMGLDV
jgi:hypothetical protein